MSGVLYSLERELVRKGNGLPMFKFAKDNSVHRSQPIGDSRPAGLILPTEN